MNKVMPFMCDRCSTTFYETGGGVCSKCSKFCCLACLDQDIMKNDQPVCQSCKETASENE